MPSWAPGGDIHNLIEKEMKDGWMNGWIKRWIERGAGKRRAQSKNFTEQ